MRTEVRLPRLGETVDTVVVLEWHRSVGDAVAEGDPLLTVETDKLTTELPSPVTGVVIQVFVEPDDEAATGQVLCAVEVAADDQPR